MMSHLIPFDSEASLRSRRLRRSIFNAAGNLGVSVAFNIQQLPVFSLWKNTDTLVQGYVTGLEPGTSFAYNRSILHDRPTEVRQKPLVDLPKN
jgi:Domain of unknown function (DUF4432)